MKRHGRFEYQAAIHRSSDFKYSYNNDINTKYSTELSPGSIHNLNGEIGIDIEFEKYKLFLIYERNQSLNYGHIDKIHFAYGFLPNKTIEYKYSFEGSNNLNSSFSIDKNINNFNLTLNLENELLNPIEYNQANIRVYSQF